MSKKSINIAIASLVAIVLVAVIVVSAGSSSLFQGKLSISRVGKLNPDAAQQAKISEGINRQSFSSDILNTKEPAESDKVVEDTINQPDTNSGLLDFTSIDQQGREAVSERINSRSYRESSSIPAAEAPDNAVDVPETNTTPAEADTAEAAPGYLADYVAGINYSLRHADGESHTTNQLEEQLNYQQIQVVPGQKEVKLGRFIINVEEATTLQELAVRITRGAGAVESISLVDALGYSAHSTPVACTSFYRTSTEEDRITIPQPNAFTSYPLAATTSTAKRAAAGVNYRLLPNTTYYFDIVGNISENAQAGQSITVSSAGVRFSEAAGYNRFNFLSPLISVTSANAKTIQVRQVADAPYFQYVVGGSRYYAGGIELNVDDDAAFKGTTFAIKANGAASPADIFSRGYLVDRADNRVIAITTPLELANESGYKTLVYKFVNQGFTYQNAADNWKRYDFIVDTNAGFANTGSTTRYTVTNYGRTVVAESQASGVGLTPDPQGNANSGGRASRCVENSFGTLSS